jgi:hypothetical protein
MHTPGFVEGDLAAPLGRTGCGSHDGLAPTLAEWFWVAGHQRLGAKSEVTFSPVVVHVSNQFASSLVRPS